MQALVIPASVTEEAASDALAAYKVGTLGRAAAVFGVPEVRVYEDPASDARDGRLVATLLSYQSTAPYLRKRLFPMRDELRHAGVLPPLNTPTHAVEPRAREGQVRQAVVRADGRVDVGLDEPARFRGQAPEGETIRVEVVGAGGGRVHVREADGPAGAFDVRRARSLPEALTGLDPAVGTSVDGDPASELTEGVPIPDGGVAFGPPGRGLERILDEEGEDGGEAFDVVVNTVPGQGTETVRTEEAVWVTLGLANAVEAGLG
jgi:predicted SPOUT superfamily RNA methylase MTH1